MESFKNLVPQYALCLRDGEKLTLKAEELTLGDIIEVKFGDRVPADIRVLESKGLKVNTEAVCNFGTRSFPQFDILSTCQKDTRRNGKLPKSQPIEKSTG